MYLENLAGNNVSYSGEFLEQMTIITFSVQY